MKKIEIPDGKEAKWVNGVLSLVDVEDNRPITERVKTFEDACAVLGENHLYVQMFQDIYTAALNEGWEPQFTSDEWRWYPWFRLLTKSDIEELSEEERCRVVGRAYNIADAYGGLVYA